MLLLSKLLHSTCILLTTMSQWGMPCMRLQPMPCPSKHREACGLTMEDPQVTDVVDTTLSPLPATVTVTCHHTINLVVVMLDTIN